MTRVLFVVLAERGHVHPSIGPAQALLAAGHHVAFYAPCDLRVSLARAGFTDVFVGDPTTQPTEHNRGAAFAELVRDPARLRAWIHSMLIDTVPLEVLRLSEVVATYRPDVIVADPMAYAAPIVAARHHLPWAGLSTSLNPVVPADWTSELITTTTALPRAALFSKYHAPTPSFRVSDCLSPHLNVAFTTRTFIRDPPTDVLLAGASLPLTDRGDEADLPALDDTRPLVLMALGSQIYHQPRMFEVVIAASRGQPWQLVMAMGELTKTIDLPNIITVPYAPQLALLGRARAMISHGGANSVMEALAHDVPLLVSPICNDQPHNARFVHEARAGITCDLATATAEQVRDHLTTLCSDGPHRASAGRIGRSYREAGGASLVARAVLELAP